MSNPELQKMVAEAAANGFYDVASNDLVAEWWEKTATLERDNDHDSRRDDYRDEDLG
jgi:hypothetical protein